MTQECKHFLGSSLDSCLGQDQVFEGKEEPYLVHFSLYPQLMILLLAHNKDPVTALSESIIGALVSHL